MTHPFVEGYMNKEAVEIGKDKPMYKRPVSSTIGRTITPLTSLILGSLDPMKPGTTNEYARRVADKLYEKLEDKHQEDYKKEHGKELPELKIYPNYTAPIENLKRLWKRKDMGVASKILGTGISPISDMLISLTRSDAYNPWSHTVSSYAKNTPILAHEMGHGEDYGQKKLKALYSLSRGLFPIVWYQEWKASRNAGRNVNTYNEENDDNEKDIDVQKFNKTLGGGLGSYIAAPLTGIPALKPLALPIKVAAALVGQSIGAVGQPFTYKNQKPDKQNKEDKNQDEE